MKKSKLVLLFAGVLAMCATTVATTSCVPSTGASSGVVDALASARTEASGTVNDYVQLTAYSEENQALITTAKTAALTAIEAATTEAEITAAVNAYKTAVDALKTLAQELAEYKTAAKTALETYKDKTLYSDTNKTAIEEAVAAGKTAIDAATDKAGVDAAVTAAHTAMDALKTLAQELEEYKTAAKTALDSYKDASLYSDANKTALAEAIAAGKAAIDAATDIAGVDAAVTAAHEAMDALKTVAQEALEAAIATAFDTLDNYITDLSVYSDTGKATIASIIAAAKDAIEDATDTDLIAEIVANAKNDLDDVLTKVEEENKVATDFAGLIHDSNSVADTSVDGSKVIFNTKRAGYGLYAEVGAQTDGATAFDAYITVHYNSVVWDSFDINFKAWDSSNCLNMTITDGKITFNEVHWDGGRVVTPVLVNKTGMKDGVEYHVQIISKGWTKAVLLDGVCIYKFDRDAYNAGKLIFTTWEAGVEFRLPKYKTYNPESTFNGCEYDNENGLWSTCVNKTLAEELADAKVAAAAELDAYISDLTLYSEANQTVIANLITEGKTAINAATNVEEVEAALAAAKTALDGVLTLAQEQDLAEALATAKQTAITELEAYVSDLSLYSDDNQVVIAGLIADGKEAINAATSVADVEKALAAAKAAIDDVPLKEQPVKTLDDIKAEAKTALASYVDLKDYSTYGTSQVNAAITAGNTAIESAVDATAVAEALAAAKAAIDAVKTKAQEHADISQWQTDSGLVIEEGADFFSVADGMIQMNTNSVDNKGSRVKFGNRDKAQYYFSAYITVAQQNADWASFTLCFGCWDFNSGYQLTFKQNSGDAYTVGWNNGRVETPIEGVTIPGLSNTSEHFVEVIGHGWQKAVYIDGTKIFQRSESNSTCGQIFISTWNEHFYKVRAPHYETFANDAAMDDTPLSGRWW